MSIDWPIPKGFFRYHITHRIAQGKFIVVARNAQQAWRKFVHQFYSQSPLKPCRSDWKVAKLK